MKDLVNLLASCTPAQRAPLQEVLGVTTTDKPLTAIVAALRRTVVNKTWAFLFGTDATYLDVLMEAAKQAKLEVAPGETDEIKLEQRICKKVAGDIFNKLSPAQQADFLAAVEKESQKFKGGANFVKSGGFAAALVAGNAGGFSTYVLASSGLAAVSGAAGITLPFAAYTGMSTALSVALGPIGWVGLGLFSLFAIGSADHKKVIPAVLCIAAMRNEPK